MKFLILLCALSAAYGKGSIDRIFKYPPTHIRFNDRIIGGEEAAIEDVPYMISLIYYVIDEDFFMNACGGSLIRPDVVLSAAHCTIFTNASNVEVSVRAGSIYADRGGQARNVTTIINHDSHPTTLNNDISLCFLLEPFILDGTTIALIALPEQDQFVPDGVFALVSGWGRTQEGGERSDVLKKLSMPTVNHDLCKGAFANHIFITDEMLCAGFLGQEGPSPCHGDSGGPFVLDDVIVGIVSFSIGCARPNYPGVFARVPSFRNWIDEHLENNKMT